ncbi:hypothetical protein M1446_05500 [Candidatus Dependentiae bacterium]|nr:hypothetical protein [Candidatus Dependentiae bacterium]
MPEIPEVEAYKDCIKRNCLNKIIEDVESAAKSLKTLIGKKFTSVERKGKYLVISLGSSDKILIMHFGMTGFLFYSKNIDKKVRFSRVNFIFKDKSVLHFIDMRKFGKIWLTKDVEKIIGKLGIDALKISKKEYLELTEKNKTKNIKAFLMDQEDIAGIGNEYADEILFQSGIDPHHKIEDLSNKNLENIYKEISKVLKYSTKLRIKDIRQMPEQAFFTKDDRYTFKSSYLQAHRHVDMICPKNKSHKLKTATIAGRTTYYCPKDQK